MSDDGEPSQDGFTQSPSSRAHLNEHIDATTSDFYCAAKDTEDFNAAKHPYRAWIVALPDPKADRDGLILRVEVNRKGHLFPSVGDAVKVVQIGVEEPHGSLRTQDKVDVRGRWRGMMEFDVNSKSGSFWNEEPRQLESRVSWDATEQLCDGTNRPKDEEHVQVWFQLRISKTTMLCELAALHKVAKNQTYQYFYHMEDPSSTVDLSKHLPHMWNTKLMATLEIGLAGNRILSSFNPHQRNALDALRKIPDGIFFMTGCPGAGKTYAALSFATLSQMGTIRTRVMYLADINRTVDDAANFMAKLYKTSGLNKVILRMHGWPKEMRQAEENGEHKGHYTDEAIATLEGLNIGDQEPAARDEKIKKDAEAETTAEPDFLRSFKKQCEQSFQAGARLPDLDGLADSSTVNEATNNSTARSEHSSALDIDTNKVLTLDQAAWQLLTRQSKGFIKLRDQVQRLQQLYINPDKSHKPCSDAEFGKLLLPLYAAALDRADFIATSPVAVAHAYFSRNWQPELVFFDEAAHAREASTLIPLAFQKTALAHIYLGDPKQSKPFAVEEEVLRVSALQRADERGAVNARLLMNRRAYGGLEQLASKLFYEGEMVPDPVLGAYGLPESTSHLEEWLNNKRARDSEVPRLLVSLEKAFAVKGKGSMSPYNPVHQSWILDAVKE